MGEFLVDHFNIIISIILFGVGLYTTLAWKHLETKFRYVKEQYMELTKQKRELEAKLERLEVCQHDMETNYISRFSDIKQDLARNKEEIVDVIHKTENRLRDNMQQLHDKMMRA